MIRKISDDLLWSQIVARAWCDDALMERLRSDPLIVLAEEGLEAPEGMDVKVVEGEDATVEDTGAVRKFILPVNRPDELMDEDLVGGAVAWCGCAACGACGRCVACAACGACGRCGCRCW
jgi:hypothetical protein